MPFFRLYASGVCVSFDEFLTTLEVMEGLYDQML